MDLRIKKLTEPDFLRLINQSELKPEDVPPLKEIILDGLTPAAAFKKIGRGFVYAHQKISALSEHYKNRSGTILDVAQVRIDCNVYGPLLDALTQLIDVLEEKSVTLKNSDDALLDIETKIKAMTARIRDIGG